MIPSRRTTVGLILFQDTVNATMMKLFKIWCSRCHTECIDIYSAITSFPIFLPNQPMLMLQRVCRIQCGRGRGDWELHKSFAFLFSFGIESESSIWHVVGPKMSVIRIEEAPRNLAFSWSWVPSCLQLSKWYRSDPNQESTGWCW